MNIEQVKSELIALGAVILDSWGNDHFRISAEEGEVASYYGFNDLPWVSPEVESVLQANGMFCEWQDPGSLGVYDI